MGSVVVIIRIRYLTVKTAPTGSVIESMAAPQSEVFHVPANLSQQTLEAILRRWQPGNSWSQIRQLLRSRRILLDGNLATDGNQRLKAGQVLKLLTQSLPAAVTEKDVIIRYLDDDVVVVEKPSGMTSIRHPDDHLLPARRQLQPTLTELLPRLLARLNRSPGGRAKSRPVRAVHRLDRETSGLMVFARNVKAETALGRQFREHTIHRIYWAIVAGRIEEQTVETNLVPDRGDGRRGSTSQQDVGKRAVTHVKPLEYVPGFTLVECRLETGRTHQIRIHLAEQGHPVCGDKVYGTRSRRQGAPTPTSPRLALHAGLLGFCHPQSGRMVEYVSPLPTEMRMFLDKVRLASPAKDWGTAYRTDSPPRGDPPPEGGLD
jgi:23S rRNA pseudouridine1911/1915/1917 synthase